MLDAGTYTLDALERPTRMAIKRLGLAVAEQLVGCARSASSRASRQPKRWAPSVSWPAASPSARCSRRITRTSRARRRSAWCPAERSARSQRAHVVAIEAERQAAREGGESRGPARSGAGARERSAPRAAPACRALAPEGEEEALVDASGSLVGLCKGGWRGAANSESWRGRAATGSSSATRIVSSSSVGAAASTHRFVWCSGRG